MKWSIVTDSACDLLPTPCGEIHFSSVPFIIRLGEQDYVDDETLDVPTMVEAMECSRLPGKTACPSPGAWAAEFEKAEQTIAITISSRLSGSMSSAQAARDIVLARHPEKKIALLDSRSTGPEIVLCVNRLLDLIGSGQNFDAIVSGGQRLLDDTHTAFVLSCFDNLVKNGRMTKAMGFFAHKLGMRGIGIATEEGEIAVRGKTRGAKHALEKLLSEMQEHRFTGGSVVISHCLNPSLAERLRDMILQTFDTARVTILPTRGLDSFYAERGGLIVAC